MPGDLKTDSWTLVRGARQLLTLHHRCGLRRGQALSELGIIVDGSVLIRNGLIENVGPTRSVENMSGARNALEIDASGRVVMPAFVDPHACLVPVPAYRTHAARPISSIPATRLEAQADVLSRIMARHGTASIGALSGHGGDSPGELKILRTLNARHRKPLDVVPVLYLDGGAAAVDEHPGEMEKRPPDRCLGLLQCVADRKLARVAAVHAGGEGEFSGPASLLRSVHALGLATRLEMLGDRQTELLESAVNLHALSVSALRPYRAPEIEILADSSTCAILLPQLLADAGRLFCAREIVDNGVLLALGSGLGPDYQSTASMQAVIQMACEWLGMSLEQAISAATVNAAWALGIGSRTGTLEYGKQADLVLLNASDYREMPMLAGTNLIHSTMKRGTVLFREDYPGWPEA